MSKKEDRPLPKPMKGLMDAIDSFFSQNQVQDVMQSIDSFFQQGLTWHSIPVYVYDMESEIVVEAELPGYNRNEIKIEFIDSYLKLSIKHSKELNDKNNKTNTFQKNRSSRNTERMVYLPPNLITRAAKASMEDGLLTINIPKRRPRRQTIDIE
ncbi:Hsp20/alpha crystallin family protein [Anaerobacillus sp. MEB173]|uniref:Hsp20/alpha crystallin family protein n=1 Tax=Anaerobacillus sp. MEB173 TaxID=3383345 RepID=UPI003F92326C